jgi:arginine utilization protein RocB
MNTRLYKIRLEQFLRIPEVNLGLVGKSFRKKVERSESVEN